MFKEICELIATRTGFVIGSTLQAGHRLQSAPVRCVVISESAGGSTVFEAPDFAFFNIQALARAATYFAARADVWAVYEAFHGTSGWNMPNAAGVGDNYLAMTVEALSIPQYLGVDDNKRHLFSVNLIFRIEQATCGAGA